MVGNAPNPSFYREVKIAIALYTSVQLFSDHCSCLTSPNTGDTTDVNKMSVVRSVFVCLSNHSY